MPCSVISFLLCFFSFFMLLLMLYLCMLYIFIFFFLYLMVNKVDYNSHFLPQRPLQHLVSRRLGPPTSGRWLRSHVGHSAASRRVAVTHSIFCRSARHNWLVCATIRRRTPTQSIYDVAYSSPNEHRVVVDCVSTASRNAR